MQHDKMLRRPWAFQVFESKPLDSDPWEQKFGFERITQNGLNGYVKTLTLYGMAH